MKTIPVKQNEQPVALPLYDICVTFGVHLIGNDGPDEFFRFLVDDQQLEGFFIPLHVFEVADFEVY